MKRLRTILAVIDGVMLAVSFCFMVRLNAQSAHGAEALTDMGRFVVWYLVFQAALVTAIALAVWALILYIHRKRK